MKFYEIPKQGQWPTHYKLVIKTWESIPKGNVLERIKRRGALNCRYEWYLNGVQIDGFTASQLLKDSH